MSRTIRVASDERELLVHVGPFPFVCNLNEISWPDHTDQEVIDHLAFNESARVKKIIRKLEGQL